MSSASVSRENVDPPALMEMMLAQSAIHRRDEGSKQGVVWFAYVARPAG